MDKLETLKRLVEQMPNNADVWYLLGVEYESNLMYSEALEAYTNAMTASENDKNKILPVINNLLKKMSATYMNNNEIVADPEETIEIDDEHLEEKCGQDYEEDDEDFQGSEREEVVQLFKYRMHKGNNKENITKTDENKRPKIKFSDVGGMDELKDIIRMKIIKPFISPGIFDRYRKKVGGGLLLYGPPGCGKTYIAKATAGECEANFIPVHISDILDPYLGVSEQNIKEIFQEARLSKPSILFFDEIDTLGFNRAKLSSEHLRSTVDQLLTEIEGIESNTDKMLIIGATNMPWDVDTALKRPGRFDRCVFVPPPDATSREIIFRLKLQGRPCENINYKLLAENTELYSGADIENVVELAVESILEEIMKTNIERPIKTEDLLSAISKSRPSTIEWLVTMKNYIKYANQGGYYNDVAKYIKKYNKWIV